MLRAWEQKEALLEQQHNQLEQGLEDLIAGGSEPSHLPHVLALTGGIGEHDQVLRQWLTERLQLLGTAQIAIISANEELEIYQQITALR